MLDWLLFGSIVFPFLAAIVIYFCRGKQIGAAVIGSVAIIVLASLGLLSNGAFKFMPESILGLGVNGLIIFLDFVLLFIILFIGIKKRNSLIIGLACLQILAIGYLEFFMVDHAKNTAGLFVDNLSLIMVLIISIIGGIICIYGLGYMKEHEHHLHLETSKQNKFFFFMILFLGAMNGLVMADNMAWLFFFWEVTTICSFMLIGHDGTEIAKKNATRALWMNMLGGAAFALALIFIQDKMDTLSLQHLLREAPKTGGVIIASLALLCFAGFTKAAQVPFQSWLCGAMVAPTPVSALLHSSTMVKAGVYLVLRLAPAYAGTELSTIVAIFGAFTFITTSALAVGQSNGKKILAYSTIANLGLIVCCAGINTAAAATAAILLIIFHAISKALLFLCMGAIEQKIGSRDIEDMRGLWLKMPRTAIITLVGIVTMMLPPFGMLLAKWMAIESAVASPGMPLIITMLALGSALTVLFWARWAGSLFAAMQPKLPPLREEQAPSISFSLSFLIFMAIAVSIVAPLLYSGLIETVADGFKDKASLFHATYLGLVGPTGSFLVYPLFVLLGAAFVYALYRATKVTEADLSDPYLCGINIQTRPGGGETGFLGPFGEKVDPTFSHYYLESVFGEDKLSGKINIVAIVILVMMLGGMLQW